MLFLLLQTLDDVEEPNFGNGDQGNDHHQGFHIEFTKHLHVCIIVKKKFAFGLIVPMLIL
jgi:hypothetical protein